jgi:hypothetical protein
MSTPLASENNWLSIPDSSGDICATPSLGQINSQILSWDYTNQLTWTVTIPAKQKQISLIWPLKADGIDEPDENLTLTLGESTTGTLIDNKTHTIVISDEDAIPSVSFDVTASNPTELDSSEDPLSIAVKLSGLSSQEITVPIKAITGSANLGTDYTLPEEWDPNEPATWQVVFPPGVDVVTIDLNIIGDLVFEKDESIIIELGEVTNAKKSLPFIHTVTISENDPRPQVEFSISNQTVLESSGYAEVEVTD